jgi:hypothetical protein
VRSLVRLGFPRAAWLRPSSHNGRRLLRIVRRVIADGSAYAEFMLHSSELMPGGSPRMRSSADVERLYRHLERLFQYVQRHFVGATLTEYYRQCVAPMSP